MRIEARMDGLDRFDTLCETGTIAWTQERHGWLGRPEEIVAALTADGFHEYKREILRSGRERPPSGGIWQGLHEHTGAVASAIWVSLPDAHQSLVFVDVDGTALRGRAA
jgi:hypothetical protein